jgi:hypothetical protein
MSGAPSTPFSRRCYCCRGQATDLQWLLAPTPGAFASPPCALDDIFYSPCAGTWAGSGREAFLQLG